MYLKLPVIAYAVSSIPEINLSEERIVLVEKSNIAELAEKIIMLLNDNDMRLTLAEKAYCYAKERFNNDNIVRDIVYAYKTILAEK